MGVLLAVLLVIVILFVLGSPASSVLLLRWR